MASVTVFHQVRQCHISINEIYVYSQEIDIGIL